jgi:hypothetical protein
MPVQDAAVSFIELMRDCSLRGRRSWLAQLKSCVCVRGVHAQGSSCVAMPAVAAPCVRLDDQLVFLTRASAAN